MFNFDKTTMTGNVHSLLNPPPKVPLGKLERNSIRVIYNLYSMALYGVKGYMRASEYKIKINKFINNTYNKTCLY